MLLRVLSRCMACNLLRRAHIGRDSTSNFVPQEPVSLLFFPADPNPISRIPLGGAESPRTYAIAGIAASVVAIASKTVPVMPPGTLFAPVSSQPVSFVSG